MWGILKALVGDSAGCIGLMGRMNTAGMGSSVWLGAMKSLFLIPSERWFLFWDGAASNSWPWFRRIICMPDQNVGCFEYSYKASTANLFAEETEGRCASDIMLLYAMIWAAVSVVLGNLLLKRRDRQRRVARRLRVHQD
jgi:hypothetical protein